MTTENTPQEIQEQQPRQEKLASDLFLNYIEEKIPNICFGIAILIAILIFITLSKYEVSTLPDEELFISFIAVFFKLLFDISFIFSSLVTAKFIREKQKAYAGIFIGITAFGFFYTIWRSIEYALSFNITEVITPQNLELETTINPVSISLICSLVLAACLKLLLAEAGAFMLYNSKEVRNSETAETKISETTPKQAEINDFAILEKEAQAKVENLPFPDSIEKIGLDSYCIDYGKSKTYETIAGNMRANRSKYNGFLKEKDVDKAANSKVLENYYQSILDTIDKQNSQIDGNWEFFPNGTLKKETERPINGHKIKEEIF